MVCPYTLEPIRQKHVSANDIDGQAGADLVAADVGSGLAHAAVVLQERLGPLAGKRFQAWGVGAAESESVLDFTDRDVVSQIACRSDFEQADYIRIVEPAWVLPDGVSLEWR